VDGFASFLGHLHPVWVHLPIGIFILLLLLELAGWLSRRPGWARMPAVSERERAFILAIAAAASVLAAALGWLLSLGGGYDTTLLTRHLWLGFATAGAAFLLFAVHRIRTLYAPMLVATLVLLTLAADVGGRITHGNDYLTAHLPPALAKVFGVAPPAPPKPRVLSFDQAQVFADVVQPILQERCVGCHGPTKSNGDLRLDRWDLLAKGGKHGLLFKPGDDPMGPLVRRIDLPVDAKEHMPPSGKPQLSDDELTLLEWWVGAGTPHDKTVAAVEPPPNVADILSTRLGGAAAEPPPDRTLILGQAPALAATLHVLIRSLSPEGPWVEVNARPAGKAFGDAELAALSAIAPAVQWLDLSGTSVTDAGLAALAPMRRLERLRLDLTKVTDAGLKRLAPLRQLASLNLRGTAVTDAGLADLRSLPRLRSLYVWQTAVTPAAVQALSLSLVDTRKIARWKAQEAELDRRIQAERFDGNTGETLRTPAPKAAAAAKPASPSPTPAPSK
jgi:uncharacterized membrane protein/mono/diheme cytochrome c family protein